MNLAAAANGYLGNKDNPARDFVVADFLVQKLRERGFGEQWVAAGYRGPRHFGSLRCRDSHHGAIENRRVTEDCGFDLERRDVVARAQNDEVLLAAGEPVP